MPKYDVYIKQTLVAVERVEAEDEAQAQELVLEGRLGLLDWNEEEAEVTEVVDVDKEEEEEKERVFSLMFPLKRRNKYA